MTLNKGNREMSDFKLTTNGSARRGPLYEDRFTGFADSSSEVSEDMGVRGNYSDIVKVNYRTFAWAKSVESTLTT